MEIMPFIMFFGFVAAVLAGILVKSIRDEKDRKLRKWNAFYKRSLDRDLQQDRKRRKSK